MSAVLWVGAVVSTWLVLSVMAGMLFAVGGSLRHRWKDAHRLGPVELSGAVVVPLLPRQRTAEHSERSVGTRR
jgi:hypothetical protein